MRLEVLAHVVGVILAIAIAIYAVAITLGIRYPTGPTLPIGVRVPAVNVSDTADVLIVDGIVYLPLPRKITNVSVEEAILWRRSIRDYTLDPIHITYLSMLLWATYGVTETRWGLRATPSAGATYPLEIYVVVGEKGVILGNNLYLDAGVYKYDTYTHTLRLLKKGDFRDELAKAALDQRWVREAPINIVITAVFERTTRVYGERGAVRYVPMEVGHAGQNVYLMATALGLGAVVVGAFWDYQVVEIISAPPEEIPMYIIPVGVPKEFRRTAFEEIQSYILGRRG